MTKTELDSKHLSELHALAAEAGIPRYRMLPRAELIERLAGEGGSSEKPREESRRQRSGSRRGRSERGRRDGDRERQRRAPRKEVAEKSKPEPAKAEGEPASPPPVPTPEPASAAPERPKRRRRRFRRRGRKGVRVHDLLLPASGRQAIVYAETRQACTELLRGVTAEVSGGKGPDPIALLIDPTPEELADWRREAPGAEIVAAGQARHADDALAQAVRRAEGGEDVIVLIDSLTRFAESFAGADEAKDLFEAGSSVPGGGSLTVVAAVEKPSD